MQYAWHGTNSIALGCKGMVLSIWFHSPRIYFLFLKLSKQNVTKVCFYLKNVLDKINSSKNCKKLPSHTAANWWGRFWKFLHELILPSTFSKNTDFISCLRKPYFCKVSCLYSMISRWYWLKLIYLIFWSNAAQNIQKIVYQRTWSKYFEHWKTLLYSTLQFVTL